ncbi:hypothetical protein PAXRUDRAFT_635430 [Paxillus rubicundulus Ve08.2h10]|uniref:Uncharacterized protein n=1 Tax=Paxillus rubicundulus Ve08.2h10 TaxID=930991 RepID=A0A0D0DXX3_9AGAM|nr:hypothetical protein PAXRUDRAFT_635430 [Paxillus rubicundulus Ve08.2h10]
MLDSDSSTHAIASTTSLNVSIISRLHAKECSDLQRFTGGCPSKLPSYQYDLSSHQYHQSAPPSKYCLPALEKTGMKVVVK